MVSSLIGYKIYSSNLTETLAKLQKTTSVARDADYYKNNIGKVSTVDEFLGDYRLYTYALKAYGLEDQANSKGLIRKVLQSDLTDSSSFANSLSDARYKTFAAAFNFKSAETKPVAQTEAQTTQLYESYSEHSSRAGVTAAAEANAFKEGMASVTSVNDVLQSPTLKNFILKSIGMGDTEVDSDYLRLALTDQLTDDNTTATDDKFVLLGAKFNFAADGSIPSGKVAQDAAATERMTYEYYVRTDNKATAPAAALETDYFKNKIASVTSVADIVGDKRLFNYVLTAYGIDPTYENESYVATILTSNVNDPASVVNQLPNSSSADALRKERFTNLAGDFAFGQNGATLPTGVAAQTSKQTDKTTANYFGLYKNLTAADDKADKATYGLLLSKINTVTDLLMNDPNWGHDALNYALKAFDIDPVTPTFTSDTSLSGDVADTSTTSLLKIRNVLQSDLSDPNSYVNKLGDPRFQRLAAAFNFDATGKARVQQMVQTLPQQTTTAALYKAAAGTTLTKDQTAVVTAETKSYLKAMQDVHSLSDLVSNKTALQFTLKAYGLDPDKVTADQARKILTSDLGDTKSYVYTLNDKKYVDFAKAFNFDTSGKIAADSGGVQGGAARLTTDRNFLLQTLEEQAGEQNEGSRLALYFLRKAPDEKTTLGLLADKALTEVVKTALGLPDSFSNLDIDKQVSVIEQKLKVADLQDPAKLDKFIKRFTGLYDIKNANTTLSNSPLLALFGSDTTSGILGLF